MARMQRNQNFSYTTDGTQNGTVTLENSLAHEVKHTYTYNTAILFLVIYPREIKLYVHTKLSGKC